MRTLSCDIAAKTIPCQNHERALTDCSYGLPPAAAASGDQASLVSSRSWMPAHRNTRGLVINVMGARPCGSSSARCRCDLATAVRHADHAGDGVRRRQSPGGAQGLDLIGVSSSTSSTVRVLAEATLALVLFADASRIDLGALRRTVGVPVRRLGLGPPLPIVPG